MKLFPSIKTITFLFLLSFTGSIAQKKMVLIKGLQTIKVSETQEIQIEDSISAKAVKDFIFYMERNPINYEAAFKGIMAIYSITASRETVSVFKHGIIYLNKRLDKYPYTKQAVILHHLAVNTGMKTDTDGNPHIRNTNFDMSAYNESIFKKQIKGGSLYRYMVGQLKEESPLNSKL